MSVQQYLADVELAWCPGCGNHGIRRALANGLALLGLPSHRVVLVTGIGQAAKMAHYVAVNGFNGLHGRTVASAAGVKMARHELTVIAESGDGDLYGEGGNHLLHNIRRNLDLTVIAHDNRVYGLTKGQASPTAGQGYTTKAQPFGSLNTPLNPSALAVALDASFVAQSFAGDVDGTAELIAEAVRHKGFALINVLQPCPIWNRVNTFAWYKERIYALADEGHDAADRTAAFSVATRDDGRIYTGVLYRRQGPSFVERHPVLKETQLAERALPTPDTVASLLEEFA